MKVEIDKGNIVRINQDYLNPLGLMIRGEQIHQYDDFGPNYGLTLIYFRQEIIKKLN